MTKEKEVIESKHWQWIKGDETGSVVTIKDEDGEWINFTQGGRLAQALKAEYLQELDSDIAGEFVKTTNSVVDPLNQSSALISQIAETTSTVPVLETTLSPIRVLFNKQKKNNKVKLLLEFPVNIPVKGVYDLMSTSFDKDEVDEQLFSFVVDQLSQDEITDCLLDSIKSLIESKYKGE